MSEIGGQEMGMGRAQEDADHLRLLSSIETGVSSAGYLNYDEDVDRKGRKTWGVGPCVGLAAAGDGEHPGRIAHMRADWNLEDDANKALLEKFRDVGVVEMFGDKDSLMWKAIYPQLFRMGIEVRAHSRTNPDESFSVIVKDGKVEWWTDQPRR